jgi:hypothetical protein
MGSRTWRARLIATVVPVRAVASTTSAARQTISGAALKCWLFGHDDWVRCTPGRVYLECCDCGRQTAGWAIARDNRPEQRTPRVEATAARVGQRYDLPVRRLAAAKFHMRDPQELRTAA